MMSSDPEHGGEVVEYPGSADVLRDGIVEGNNKIPAWFNWSWIATWIFGVIYIAYYLGFSSWSSTGQYEAEVSVARVQAEELRASLPQTNPFHGNEAAIAEGSQVFTETCVACHLPNAQGLVGPSLVDPYWKYGSSDPELYATVADGRPGGMPGWSSLLGAEKIWKVLAYLETLPKTREPGMGAPDYKPPAQ
jgi:cytochrome c oxidase cbb3-type subunit 3